MEDLEGIAWRNADVEDLWIFDKLIVARKLGYVCGPAGVDVPYPAQYIVRPCVNIPGKGRGAHFTHIDQDTGYLPSGTFWCERFEGRHISVDYLNGEQVLAVEGFRENKNDELWRFSAWEKIPDVVPLPSIFYSLTKKYKYINVEYIDGNPIEIHLRHNPDFAHGNTIAYPVWKDREWDYDIPNLRYIESPDYKRLGFYID